MCLLLRFIKFQKWISYNMLTPSLWGTQRGYDTQIRIAPTIFGMIGLGILILNRQSLVFSEASEP